VETGEGDEVDSQFSEIGVELTGKSKAAGDSGHGSGDEMVEISVCGGCQFEGSEADIIECLIVNDHALISVLDQLMHRESGVVGLNHSVRHFGGGNDRESLHDTIGILLTDFGDE